METKLVPLLKSEIRAEIQLSLNHGRVEIPIVLLGCAKIGSKIDLLCFC
jgi:hypothetical protein